jgi:hypothetical protein
VDRGNPSGKSDGESSAFSSQKPMPISRYIVAAIARCSRALALSVQCAEVAVSQEPVHCRFQFSGEFFKTRASLSQVVGIKAFDKPGKGSCEQLPGFVAPAMHAGKAIEAHDRPELE